MGHLRNASCRTVREEYKFLRKSWRELKYISQKGQRKRIDMVDALNFIQRLIATTKIVQNWKNGKLVCFFFVLQKVTLKSLYSCGKAVQMKTLFPDSIACLVISLGHSVKRIRCLLCKLDRIEDAKNLKMI